MAGISLAIMLIALAYLSAWLPGGTSRLAPWLMGSGIALLLAGLLWLGTRHPQGRRSRWAVAASASTGLLLLGGFGAALLLPVEGADSLLLLGLPRRAAMLVYGVGILPALLLPFAYALGFRSSGLSDTDLAEFRDRLAKLRKEREQ